MAALDWLQQLLGQEQDQGAPMALQNRQGGFDPYTPQKPPDALELLYEMSGGKDMSQAYKAYQRGEYLPAFGQGAWGATQAASLAYPALKAGGAALRGAAPLAREAAGAIPGMLADETGAIRAYHGSPHSFDKFDLSKIGTGEGAQAYGHGLYFAEAEDVARGYRDTLAGKAPLREYGGQPLETNKDWYSLIDKVEPQDWRLARIIDAAGKQGGVRSALDTFEPHTRNASDGPQWAAAIERFKEGVGPAAKGHMYEVDIHADPKAFLDWDRPLAGQPEAVRRNVESLFAGNDEILSALPDATAEGITQRLMPMAGYGRGGGGIAHDAISEELNRAGIPGIRYLDQGSRFNPAVLPDNPIANEAREFLKGANGDAAAAWQAFKASDPVSRWGASERDEIRKVIEAAARRPTSNYAVFDDKLIEIRRKYGLLPPLAAGGLLGAAEE